MVYPMTKKRFTVAVICLSGLFLIVENANASDNLHRLRIGLGSHNVEEKTSAESISVAQTSAVLGYTFGGEKWFADVLAESTPTKKGVGGDVNATIQFTQGALTVGRFFGDHAAVFVSFSGRSIDSTDRDIAINNGDLISTTSTITTTAIGGSYSWFVGTKSAIGLSVAASAAGASIESFDGDDKLSSFDGNRGTGFSLGLDFSSPITEHLGYAIKLSAQAYDWKAYKSSQTDAGIDLQDTYSRAHIYLFYDF